MDGEIPKFLIADRASRAKPPVMPRRALPFRLRLRWHWVALAALCVPLSFVLVRFDKTPNADMLAANTDGAKLRAAKSKASGDRTSIDTFEDRFPTLQFADRVLVLRDGAVAAWGPPASVLPPLRAAAATGATPQPA